MSAIAIDIPLALAFAVLLLWLLRPRRQPSEADGSSRHRTLESSLPTHYKFFPQIRRALSADDDRYLRQVAPPDVTRRVLRERRAVAMGFLRGLHEDFSSLERLARMVASLSPVLNREQEVQRIVLGLRFRVLYRLVWLRLSLGRVPLQQIEHMTELVGRLALRMEQAMSQISALSADRVSTGLNA